MKRHITPFQRFVETRQFTADATEQGWEGAAFLYGKDHMLHIGFHNDEYLLVIGNSSWTSADLHVLEAELYAYAVSEDLL